MATRAATFRAPALRRWALWAVAVLVIALGAAAVAAFVWLRTYAPLSGLEGGSVVPGDGIASEVEPATGSGGKTVYFTTTRMHGRATAGFDLTNTGRFAVRLDGVETASLLPGVTPAVPVAGVKLSRARVSGATHDVLRPFHALSIPSHRSVFIVVRYATACSPTRDGVFQISTDRIRVRYTYLRVFHRTQVVETPYALTLQCGGKLPASTPVP